MIASRKAIRVKILEGMTKNINEYTLMEADHDIESYYFAGSLPGAVVATSADAKVKNDEAEDRLATFRENTFTESESAERLRAFLRPPDGNSGTPVNPANQSKLRNWIDTDPDAAAIVGLPFANFFTNRKIEELRLRAIKDLNIP